MRHHMIEIKFLTDYDKCVEAIEAIENDPNNYSGNWFDGSETPMKQGAKNKVAAIWRKIYRLTDGVS